MLTALRTLLTEPPPTSPSTPAWGDRVLVALLVPAALLEAVLREGLAWRPVVAALGVVTALALLGRRTRPFALFVAVFVVGHLVGVVAWWRGVAWVDPYSSVVVLLLVYSLFRWGAGWEAGVGLLLLAGGFAGSAATGGIGSLEEAVGGTVVMLFVPVVGASVRFRAHAQLRELDQVRLLERERLARELHDTVAHHMSAIAIQAQAGQAVAKKRPEAAVQALAAIEQASSRALAEVRDIVGALRERQADPALAPAPSLTDLHELARRAPPSLSVDVDLEGELDELRPAMSATVFRLAQESITNAVRHARNASKVEVRVVGERDAVRVTVTDDGDPAPFGQGTAGYGLVGMRERAALLGGTVEAGPLQPRGWRVVARLPRHLGRGRGDPA